MSTPEPKTFMDLLKMAYDGLEAKYTALYPPVEREYVAQLEYETTEGWQVYCCPRCCDRIVYHPVYAVRWALSCHCTILYAYRGNNELAGVGIYRGQSEHAIMRESVQRLVELTKRYPEAFKNTKDK